jgi:general stress protein YciG
MTVREAGKKGGLSCLRNRGRGFFSEIGAAGQQTMRDRYPGMAREWGRRGGRPRKRGLADIMGETKK